MELTDTLQTLRERYLPDVLNRIDATIKSASGDSSLREMADYHLSTGGKRLRALLPLAVAQALGEDPVRLIGFAAACEVLHNATLVHDDLQDGDRVRRGQDTVWVKYGSARAINLGDALLYYTILLAQQVDFDVEAREALVQRLLRETLTVIDGQEREFLLKDSDRANVDLMDEYVRMVTGKTSGLFALPIVGAAELCGASPELCDALHRASVHLGVIFQIQDDVLDLFGEKGRQRVGTDIAEGKFSVLAVHCLTHASAEDSSWLADVLSTPRDDVDDATIARATGLIRETGSLAYALQEIERRSKAVTETPAFAAHPNVAALIRATVDVFVAPIAEVQL